MDFKQQNGQQQFPRSSSNLRHQSSIASSISSSTQSATQKVTLRRRCRSESLPMAPMCESKSGKSRVHNNFHQNHSNKTKGEAPTLVIESFSLHNHSRKTLPIIASNELLPSITISNAKENVMHNGHVRLDGGINAKDVYMNELDAYRKDRRSGYYLPGERQLESRFARNLESSFNPRSTMYDRSNRKLRARSESEPHEIYTSASMINGNSGSGRSTPAWINRDLMRDISLKRTRDNISPTLETDETLEFTASPIARKDSPPSKMLNASESNGLEDVISTAQQRLGKPIKNSGSANGTRFTKTVRTRTGTAVNKYKSCLKSAPATVSAIVASGGSVAHIVGRKSVSPPLLKPLPGSTSPTPSGMSTGTSGGESVHTQDLDTETIGHSDVGEDDDLDDECGGEEDDLGDELGDDDEALNGSITDSEDNYQTHLAAYQARTKSNSASPSPSLGRGPVTSIGCVLGGSPPEGPLTPSLFPYVPPYITFSNHEEKGPEMPPAIHKVLKWKMTLITPIVVRKVLLNSGFRLLKKTNDWIGIWGKHMKSPCFKTLRPYQKFNHLPGSFQIGRKDRVWRNLQTQMNRHGKKEFGFMPRTYVLPQDLKILRQMWPRYSQRNAKWIIKPPASARGTGIKVVNRWSQIPKRKPLVVQRYIERPLLINGSKFDLRLYVLVTSINPLRVYMHTDGLARFASVKYSEKPDTLSDRYMHLTNYSINKLSNNYNANEDADACQGHKWTIKSLWSYFAEQGINTERLWGALRNLVLRTVLAGEGPIYAMSKLNVASRYNCYELFGIDVLLDSELVPWLLEVNISPSLHSASTLDAHVKGPLVKALLNTVMYQVPPRIALAEQKEILAEQGLEGPLCYDKRIYVTALSKQERLKHNQYIQKDMARDEYLNNILDELTPDDLRCLLLTEDELARSAPLERILPAPNSHRYVCFTEHPRYYNRLLDAWEHRYCQNRSEGITLLQSMCQQKIHLQVPPSTFKKDSNNKHQTEISSGSTNNENASQDSGIQSDPASSELQSQESCSAFQSQESIDQIGDDESATTNKSGSIDDVRKLQQQRQSGDDESDNIRLSDKIKLILDDALLLKQQQCGDTDNAIIVQQ